MKEIYKQLFGSTVSKDFWGIVYSHKENAGHNISLKDLHTYAIQHCLSSNPNAYTFLWLYQLHSEGNIEKIS